MKTANEKKEALKKIIKVRYLEGVAKRQRFKGGVRVKRWSKTERESRHCRPAAQGSNLWGNLQSEKNYVRSGAFRRRDNAGLCLSACVHGLWPRGLTMFTTFYPPRPTPHPTVTALLRSRQRPTKIEPRIFAESWRPLSRMRTDTRVIRTG